MSITLHIPDSIISGMRLPENEIESRLRIELAVGLYVQSLLSFGKGSELAGLSRDQLANLLGQRTIARHYEAEELAEDLHYARSE